MTKLVFKPQKVFAPAYNTKTRDIIGNRSFFSSLYDYFVDYGGRGGGKTKDKVRSIVLEASIRPVRVLVTRELQNSIEESVKAEIEACIFEEGLDHFFKITEKQIVGRNGSKFIFKGLKNNINNIKSIADVDIVLVEEAENVSARSWEKLLPSIRPNSGRAIVVVIFNPDSELDATWNTWIVDTPERTLLTPCNYYDNEHFPEFLERMRLHDKKVMPPAAYKKKWLGKPSGVGGDVIIDLEWINAARFASKNPDWQSVGNKRVGYDPAGQGKDTNAVSIRDGNRITDIDEWVKSSDLRVATIRAMKMARDHNADEFSYDECGGFGDGVSVFVNDHISGKERKQVEDREDENNENEVYSKLEIDVIPFNAGDSIEESNDQLIKNTEKKPSEIYLNQKAHAHGVFAQQLYNTYRFIVLGERDIDFNDMISIDFEDDDIWRKFRKEASAPIWIKSKTNSKKKVESKDDMKKRIGQDSPNICDSIIMTVAPAVQKQQAGGFDW